MIYSHVTYLGSSPGLFLRQQGLTRPVSLRMKAAVDRRCAGRSKWALHAHAEPALRTIVGRVGVYLQFRDESTNHRPVEVWGAFSRWRFKIRFYRDRFSFVLLKWTLVNILLIDFSY